MQTEFSLNKSLMLKIFIFKLRVNIQDQVNLIST